MRNTGSPLMAADGQYLDALWQRYVVDPASVDVSWRILFDVLTDLDVGEAPLARIRHQGTAADSPPAALERFRAHGHLAARLDPLGRSPAPEALERLAAAGGSAEETDRLTRLYCGALTLESAHIDDAVMRDAVLAAYEDETVVPDVAARRRALELLCAAEEFERLLGVRYPTKKRFGAEGAEALVPLLDRILAQAARAGVSEVRVGTMHRGRLNLMANVLGKPLIELFAEFTGAHPFVADPPVPADVPYHLGHDAVLTYEGHALRVVLAPNPSHLEAIDPVIPGRTRAVQDKCGAPTTALCIVLHTDASVVAQGVVAETLQLSGVAGFSVAGTIHIVVNNQIGFTTNQDEARTSRHCTGPWKAVDSAILHVNGDDVDAVLRAADLAVRMRQETGRDAVVDLVCYRRNGHNEIDEPRFTQPLEYGVIDAHAGPRELYARHLAAKGVVSAAEADALAALARERYQAALAAAAEYRPNRTGYPEGAWAGYDPAASDNAATGVEEGRLRDVLDSLSSWPEDMTIDRKVQRIVRQRAASADTGLPWAVAEALAFGTLLTDATPVRLTGQDVIRGAFSHRHFALTDTVTGKCHVSLNGLAPGQARFDIINSPLSEYAVLGFEYGYSLERPDTLVIWEAQFGDFANGAQIMFDQFLSSAEDKWHQPSGLVVLLPHGLEGQGPEHSSARPERLLQLAGRGNIRVAHPSTPANYFHLLRRQALAPRKKPLVVLSPKTLLRLPAAISPLSSFGPGEQFAPVLAAGVDESVRRVLLCSGKLAYALERKRPEDTAVLRLEMLYPLPSEALVALFRQMPQARYAWVQEEPENHGAWSYLDRRIEALLRESGVEHPRPACVARPEAASPAGSFHGDHETDQRHLIDAAFAI